MWLLWQACGLLFLSAELLEITFLFYHLGKVYHGHKQNLCKNLFSAFLDPESQKVVTGKKRGSWKSITYKKGPLGGQWLEKKKQTDKNYWVGSGPKSVVSHCILCQWLLKAGQHGLSQYLQDSLIHFWALWKALTWLASIYLFNFWRLGQSSNWDLGTPDHAAGI